MNPFDQLVASVRAQWISPSEVRSEAWALGGRHQGHVLEGARSELKTAGIRAHVRHPIYLGHLCEVVGWCIGTGLMPLFALLGFAIASGAAMVHVEDRELEARFGESYRAYRRAVPAVIPRLLRQQLQ